MQKHKRWPSGFARELENRSNYNLQRQRGGSSYGRLCGMRAWRSQRVTRVVQRLGPTLIIALLYWIVVLVSRCPSAMRGRRRAFVVVKGERCQSDGDWRRTGDVWTTGTGPNGPHPNAPITGWEGASSISSRRNWLKWSRTYLNGSIREGANDRNAEAKPPEQSILCTGCGQCYESLKLQYFPRLTFKNDPGREQLIQM